MNRIFLCLSLLFALSINSSAQSYIRTEHGVKTTINAADFEVRFYSPSIVRIVKWPSEFYPAKESLSVVKEPQATDFTVSEQNHKLLLESDELVVTINTNDGSVSFESPSGKSLLQEQEAGTGFTEFDDAGEKTYSVSQSFNLDKDEAIYGLGFQQQGKMMQRDVELYMVQGNTETYIPFFQSVKGYGLFWDNYSPTTFLDDKNETSFTSEVGECVDYFFIYGENADGVIAGMRDLTGEVPLFPLWTYGYWQSRERYKGQDETVGVVKKYRDLGVPLDGIIQDWQYWGNNYLWNAMEFLNTEFPNPQQMVDDVHDMNAHMIISIWSSFGPETKQYRDLKEGDMLLDFITWPQSGVQKWPPNPDYPSGVRAYDPYNPEARDIYWKYLKEGLLTYGIDGWWMDSTEPDHLEFKPEDFDNQTYLGSFRKVRNAYPLMTVGGVYSHQRAFSSDKRIFILTRSAFAGQQRYGANTWTGDVVASWETLKNQISAGLNFSLCGIPHWNSDIGGFFLWNHDNPLESADYRELYARWLQFGTFSPMMRSHGTDAPREIYQFGKKGDEIYDAIEKFINLRYRLLPYIYSNSWDVSANQSTFMRALMMDFPEDNQALDINDQYMFGKSLLVCPVTKPMYTKAEVNGRDTTYVADFSEVKADEVYLPGGTDWYDFWTGERFSGKQTIKKETPVDVMPLFVKAGSILPIGPQVQYAEEKPWDNLEIRIYEGADGEFVLYEDENDNYNYEEGVYSTIAFSWNDATNTLTISDREGSFPGMLEQRKFNVVLVSENAGIGMAPAAENRKEISYSGKKEVVKL